MYIHLFLNYVYTLYIKLIDKRFNYGLRKIKMIFSYGYKFSADFLHALNFVD